MIEKIRGRAKLTARTGNEDGNSESQIPAESNEPSGDEPHDEAPEQPHERTTPRDRVAVEILRQQVQAHVRVAQQHNGRCGKEHDSRRTAERDPKRPLVQRREGEGERRRQLFRA